MCLQLNSICRAALAYMLCISIRAYGASSCIGRGHLCNTQGRRMAAAQPAIEDAVVQQLRRCYNANFTTNSTTFTAYYGGHPTKSLHLHRIWWSRRNTTLPLTLFTVADVHRLQALAAQCRSYPDGPLSVAVYLPLFQPPAEPATTEASGLPVAPLEEPVLSPANAEELHKLTETLDALFQAMELQSDSPAGVQGGGSSCALRMLLVVEIVADEEMLALLPLNALRNAAMLAATTPLMAQVDVDLVVSSSLAGSMLVDGKRVEQLIQAAERNNSMYVIPTFEVNHRLNHTYGNAMADAAIAVLPDTKASLREMWKTHGVINPFASERYPAGHMPTNFDKWFASKTAYAVPFPHGYEPWFMGIRRKIPLYDARFRGYGYDKVVYTQALADSGVTYWVLPDAWLVHRPHDPAPLSHHNHNPHADKRHEASLTFKMVEMNGKQVTVRHASYICNAQFHTDALKFIRKGAYLPVADPASQHCRSVLSWWTESS